MPVDEYACAYVSRWMQPTVVFVANSDSCTRELLLHVDPQVLICGSGASQPATHRVEPHAMTLTFWRSNHGPYCKSGENCLSSSI